MMGDTELEQPLAQQEEEEQPQKLSPSSPASPSVSISSSPSLSLPSSPSSGPHHQQALSLSPSPSPGEGPATPSPTLDVISEGVGELSLVIDPEVAKRACHEVLQKVKQLKGDGDGSGSESGSGATDHAQVNGTGLADTSADGLTGDRKSVV